LIESMVNYKKCNLEEAHEMFAYERSGK